MPTGIQNGTKKAENAAGKNCSTSAEIQLVANKVITCSETLAVGNK